MATTKSQQLSIIEKQLEQEANALSNQIGSSESKRITIDGQLGEFVTPEGLALGSEIEFIVIDFLSANRYYTAAYDPNNLAPPVCFAFGKNLADMVPSEASPERQHENCKLCPWNQFGSRGAGKACKNTRELAVLLVGDPEDLDVANDPLYTISVPPTSLKSFDQIATFCKATFNGPPIKAVIKAKVNKVGVYSNIMFTGAEAFPLYADAMARREEAYELISKEPDVSRINERPKPNRPVARR